jgi:hypothetical protein
MRPVAGHVHVGTPTTDQNVTTAKQQRGRQSQPCALPALKAACHANCPTKTSATNVGPSMHDRSSGLAALLVVIVYQTLGGEGGGMS